MRKRFMKIAMIFLTISLLTMVSCSVVETTGDQKLDSNDDYGDEVKNDNKDSEPDDSVYSTSETEDPNLLDPEDSTPLPWENGGKQPEDYTWKEFEALTGGQQIAFQNDFNSIGDFDAWLQEAQYDDLDNPWENGGKQPKDYTWEEFEALTPGQQIAFQNSFENIDEFDKWLNANCPQ